MRKLDELPPVDVQRRWLDSLACENIVFEDSTPDGQRRLRQRLRALRAGDCLAVFNLRALDFTTGELAVFLRKLCDLGVAIQCLDDNLRYEVLEASAEMSRALSLLAAHEERTPSRRRRSRPDGRSRRDPARPLTQYQIDYANKLMMRGTPLRDIGLLFQMAPDEIWELLDARRRGPARSGAGEDKTPPTSALRTTGAPPEDPVA